MKDISSTVLYKLAPVAVLLPLLMIGMSVWLNGYHQMIPEDGISFNTINIDAMCYDLDSLLIKQELRNIKSQAKFEKLLAQEAFLSKSINKQVSVQDSIGNHYPIRFIERPLASVSLLFWLHPILAAIVIWLGIATVYIGGINRYPVLLFAAATCLALFIMMSVAAMDSQWAINPNVLYWRYYFSDLSLRLFIFFLVFILWQQPYDIGRRTWVKHMPWAVLGLLVIPWFIQAVGIYKNLAWMIVISLLFGSVFTIIAIFLQWQAAYAHSAIGAHLVNQIAMRWLAATIVVCTVFGLGFQLIHELGLVDSMGPHLFDASVATLLMLGVVILLLRSQLYRVHTWWWRAWEILGAFSIGFIAFVVCNEAAIAVSDVALGITLSTSIASYYVLTTLFRSVYTKHDANLMQQIIPKLVDVVATFSDPKLAHEKWCQILEQTFEPQNLRLAAQPSSRFNAVNRVAAAPLQPINSLKHAMKAGRSHSFYSNNDFIGNNSNIDVSERYPVHICDDGASMQVLGFNNEQVVLEGAARGRRLFNKVDEQRVLLLWRIASQGQAAQNAYLEGERSERAQIADELQDDIGKKLVHMIVEGGQYSHYATNTLHNLNMLTKGLYAQKLTVAELLADINFYFGQSCEFKAVDYVTAIDIAPIETLVLSAQAATLLSALLNELLRNALQHEQTTRITLSIVCLTDELYITVANDGLDTDPKQWHLGLGIISSKRRVYDIAGHIEWVRQDGGGVVCQVRLSIANWIAL